MYGNIQCDLFTFNTLVVKNVMATLKEKNKTIGQSEFVDSLGYVILRRTVFFFCLH